MRKMPGIHRRRHRGPRRRMGKSSRERSKVDRRRAKGRKSEGNN